jgi:hypothetical protein
MDIMGITGRGTVLRSVSQTIGLDGDKVVPADEALQKKQDAKEKNHQQQDISEQVNKGIQAGVEQGVQKITAELTSGFLASRAQMPGDEPGMDGGEEGGPPPEGGAPPGMGPPDGGPPGMGPPGGGGADAMRQMQGNRPAPMNKQLAQPENVVGNQPQIRPGMRPRPIVGGPG